MSRGCDVQHFNGAPDQLIEITNCSEVRKPEADDIYARPRDPVVPPDRSTLPLDQFQKAVEDRLAPVIPCGVPIGIRPAEVMCRVERIAEVAIGCGQVFHLLPRQRPRWRPGDAPLGVEAPGHPVMTLLAMVPAVPIVVLRFAEKGQRVRVNRFIGDLRVARHPPRFIAAEYPRVPFERFTKAAYFGLQSTAACALNCCGDCGPSAVFAEIEVWL